MTTRIPDCRTAAFRIEGPLAGDVIRGHYTFAGIEARRIGEGPTLPSLAPARNKRN